MQVVSALLNADRLKLNPQLILCLHKNFFVS